MKKNVLFRKQLEFLKMADELILEGDNDKYLKIRDGVFDLFYENQYNLKTELIEIVPTDMIASIRELIEVLKNCYSLNFDRIYAINAGPMDYNKAHLLIEKLSTYIQEAQNKYSNHAVFYSWQSDRLQSVNRSFIEDCILKAIKRINNELPYQLYLDKDTRNAPGSPNIPEIICQKIDNSFCFIADVTPVYDKNGESLPNSNVMFETGYAISSLSDKRVILVSNSHYGKLESLPFDVKIRRVASYNLSKTSTSDEKAKEKSKLIDLLYLALKTIANI